MCEMSVHAARGCCFKCMGLGWLRGPFVVVTEMAEGGKEFGVEWLADLCGVVKMGIALGGVGFWC